MDQVALRLDSFTTGMRIVVSKYVPAPGWHRKLDAAYIERDNLAALCAGASLGELEPTRTYSTGMFVVRPPPRDDFLFFSHRDHTPHILMHPSLQEQVAETLRKESERRERACFYGLVTA